MTRDHRPDRRTLLNTRHPDSPRRPRHAARRIAPAALVALLALVTTPAQAQRVRPWTPPVGDSLTVRAARANELFRRQAGDTVDATSYRAYEAAGLVARDLVRSLGRGNLAQAGLIEAALDSLGLESAVAVDPRTPEFALVTMRNPHRASALAVGFLFWYRGNSLHQQGTQLPSGRAPQLRAWFTGRPERPYTLCVLDRTPDGRIDWVVLGLNATGDLLTVLQAMGAAGAGGRGQGSFVDADGDGLPEIAVWTRAAVDSLFTVCPECPGPIDGALFGFHERGYELEETHPVPTAFSTFSMFVRFLQDGNRASAARLLEDPGRLDEALALGWGRLRAPGSWAYEYAEPGERWPRWIAVRYLDAKRQLYIVRFGQRAGRLVIREWTAVKPPAPRTDAPAPAGGGGR